MQQECARHLAWAGRVQSACGASPRRGIRAARDRPGPFRYLRRGVCGGREQNEPEGKKEKETQLNQEWGVFSCGRQPRRKRGTMEGKHLLKEARFYGSDDVDHILIVGLPGELLLCPPHLLS